jgi:hypothetical protein
MGNDNRPLIWRPEVLRQIAQVTLASLAVTGVILALLWPFVGPPSFDAMHSSLDYTCWRCLDDVAMATSQVGWAVGEEPPFLLRYVDGAWTWQPGPARTREGGWFLGSATLVSATEGWAAGSSILHYRDGRWTEELNFGQQTVVLDDIAAASPQEAWAVGGSWYADFGFIWRYQDGAWSKVYNAPNTEIVAIASPAVGDAWAVAIRYKSEGHPSGGSLLHYRDGAWTDAFDTSIILRDIAMTSPTDGCATGNDASGAGIFLHYTDGIWTQAAAMPDTTIGHLAMISADEGWATGTIGVRQNALFHYLGGVWSPVVDPVLSQVTNLRGIAAPEPGEVWVAALVKGSWRTDGVLLRFHGGRWSMLQIPKTPPNDEGEVIGMYADIGFNLFIVVACVWLLVTSFWAPRGSARRHWLTRAILASLALQLIGILISYPLSLLFADDLTVDPTHIASIAESVLLIPSFIALCCFGMVAVVVVGLRWNHTTSSTR